MRRFAAASFIVLLALGFALAYTLGHSVEASALKEARQNTQDTLYWRVQHRLHFPADFQHPMTGKHYKEFQAFVHDSVLSTRTVRVKLWTRTGQVLYSDDPSLVGRHFPIEDELVEAGNGELVSDLSDLTAPENRDERKYGNLLEVYMPVRAPSGGPVLGVFEAYETYTPIAQQIASLQRMVYVGLGAGFFLLYLLLFGIVRAGSRTITSQQKELSRYTRELEDNYRQTIASLAAAVDARDRSTELHSLRVRDLSVALGRFIGIGGADLRDLEHGALLHDVGKIGVADAILHKPGKLTVEEWEKMRRHPEIGYHMLKGTSFLAKALPLVRHHHERWDGAGYPQRLAGKNIPLAARLFAVIDAYDAMTSNRPYRAAMSHEAAMAELRRSAGTHFDPDMVEAFGRMMDEAAKVVPMALADARASESTTPDQPPRRAAI